MIKLGITINDVSIKKVDQSLRKSTNSPLKDANVVRPKLPKDANRAYCVAEKACPVSSRKRQMPLSKGCCAIDNNGCQISAHYPHCAIHANMRLLAAIATPPIISPRTIPNFTLKTLPNKVKNIVALQIQLTWNSGRFCSLPKPISL